MQSAHFESDFKTLEANHANKVLKVCTRGPHAGVFSSCFRGAFIANRINGMSSIPMALANGSDPTCPNRLHHGFCANDPSFSNYPKGNAESPRPNVR